jgi:hypothetical protein
MPFDHLSFFSVHSPFCRNAIRTLLLIPTVIMLWSVGVTEAQLAIRDTTFRSIVDTGRTADVDLTTFPNSIILQTGTNTNLALNKGISVRYANRDPSKISSHPTASNPALMIDGRVAANSFFELLPGQEGTQIRIDLQAVRVVNRVVTRVFPANSVNFRVRGYSIYLGLDTLSYRKVKQVVDNERANTDDFFDPDTARYVLFVVEKQDPSLTNPFSTTFGEIEVYGVGYLQEGRFTSVVRDARYPVNWGRASWRGNIPNGTAIRMQVRTGDTPNPNASWSPWSDEVTVSNSLFTVFEPRRYMQYRVNLYTFTIETPRLDEVMITYDTTLVSRRTTARVLPQAAPILREAEFQYQVQVEHDSRSTGIDTLVIFTTVPIVVNSVRVNDLNIPFNVILRPGQVVVAFGTTINFNATVNLGFRFTPFLEETSFPSIVISRQNPTNPQRVDFTTSNETASWTLLASGVPEKVIVDARADPNPFTPNGDGKNDLTYFSFFVSNLVIERPLQIKIYDVTGRIVRTLVDTKTTAQAFVEQNAVPWDGRDDGGRLLPPGLYIYQIVVEVDGVDPAVVTKTISIAY